MQEEKVWCSSPRPAPHPQSAAKGLTLAEKYEAKSKDDGNDKGKGARLPTSSIRRSTRRQARGSTPGSTMTASSKTQDRPTADLRPVSQAMPRTSTCAVRLRCWTRSSSTSDAHETVHEGQGRELQQPSTARLEHPRGRPTARKPPCCSTRSPPAAAFQAGERSRYERICGGS